MGVSVEGIREVTKQLEEFANQVTKQLPQIVEKSVSPLKDSAKEKAPVITGALRDSIVIDVEVTPEGVTVEVGPTVDYGDDVEFGGLRRPAKPYLRSAADETENLVVDSLVDALDKVLKDL